MDVKKYMVLLLLVFVTGCNELGNNSAVLDDDMPSEVGEEIEVYFCPNDNCEDVLVNVVNSSSEKLHCAFFDIDLRNLIKVIGKKSHSFDVKLVVDNENYGEIKGPGVKKDTSSQYSHNKFCVIDDKVVLTGSMNPTDNGAYKNNNNLLVIYSKYLAKNYEDEFKELWNGEFGSGVEVKYPVMYLNNHEIENYFCPEDLCSEKIIKELRDAAKSIYFMTFSFTNEGIADAILFNDDADIKGLFEKRGSGSKYSQYNRLKDFGIEVKVDSNSYTMHHKVFIIDNRTVITGSMNPTGSGDNKNDENVLIIHDKAIAKKYVEEFFRLYDQGT
ncbi:MAG: phospholipase D-like domain-containing protein [Nanoarchaeota archaeon]|nr:phospholipase D-like domain-containing protein [Nanoarchaeota archaeon]